MKKVSLPIRWLLCPCVWKKYESSKQSQILYNESLWQKLLGEQWLSHYKFIVTERLFSTDKMKNIQTYLREKLFFSNKWPSKI